MKAVPVERLLALLGAAQDGGGRVPVALAATLLGVREDDMPDVVEALCMIELPPHGDCLDLALDGAHVVFDGLPSVASSAPLTLLDGALLLASLNTLRRKSGRRVAHLCNESARRVKAGLGEPSGSEAEARSEALAWAVDDDAGATETLSQLQEAAESRRVVRLRYWNVSRDAVEDRRVRPVDLCQHTGRWYLGATDLGRDAYRWFRLERILSVTVTEDTFTAESPRSVARDVLFDPPAVPVELVVRFESGWLRQARGQLDDAWVGRTATGVKLRGPTLETLVRRLFALEGGWEIVEPEAARALVRAWAGGPTSGPREGAAPPVQRSRHR